MRLKNSLLGVATAAVMLAAASAPATVSASTALASTGLPPSTALVPSGAPSTSTAVPTNPPPTGAACNVRYSAYTWDTYLTSSITITNTGATTITPWVLEFPLPAGQHITTGWNAVYSPPSGEVTARGLDDHVIIGPGAAIAIGFVATHTGDTGSPSSFTLNGTPCTLG